MIPGFITLTNVEDRGHKRPIHVKAADIRTVGNIFNPNCSYTLVGLSSAAWRVDEAPEQVLEMVAAATSAPRRLSVKRVKEITADTPAAGTEDLSAHDLDNLEARAIAAGGGTFRGAWMSTGVVIAAPDIGGMRYVLETCVGEDSPELAFVEAANPNTVLALIKQLRAKEKP
jgi:hypothetical protein